MKLALTLCALALALFITAAAMGWYQRRRDSEAMRIRDDRMRRYCLTPDLRGTRKRDF